MCVFLTVVAAVLLAASPADSPRKFSSFDAQVKPLLARMTLEEKIGQMTQPDQMYIKDLTEIESLAFGSILSGGSSDPKEGNSLQAWTDLYERLQQHALKSRLKIPILYGIDAVHGNNNLLGAVIFPHNIGLGCTRNPSLVEKVERVTAEEVRASGIQWAFAPCVTVPQDARWGRTYEGFSEDPQLVKQLGEAAVKGMQTNDLSNPLAVLACAKHFIGDGGTTFGSVNPRGVPGNDQGDTRVDEDTLHKIHLQGYISTVNAGVGSIMPSYNSWNGVKVSGIKHLLTDLLKGEMGFEGFLISDYNAVDQIDRDYKKAIGILDQRGHGHGDDGAGPLQEVHGRFEGTGERGHGANGAGRRCGDAHSAGEIRNEDAGSEAVADGGSRGGQDVRVSGAPAGGARCGAAIASAAEESGRRAAHEEDGSADSRSGKERGRYRESVRRMDDRLAGEERRRDDRGDDGAGGDPEGGAEEPGDVLRELALGAALQQVGVVVIGEKPYAEGQGDRGNLALAPEDVAAIANMKAAGIPVVTILFSGRPMILGESLDKSDAFVAAWLPGTEGDGIADVLFGDYKPTGKLSFAWPRSMEQYPRDKDTNPLFALGMDKATDAAAMAESLRIFAERLGCCGH